MRRRKRLPRPYVNENFHSLHEVATVMYGKEVANATLYRTLRYMLSLVDVDSPLRGEAEDFCLSLLKDLGLERDTP